MESINQNPMPRIEVLPHAVEKAFEYAERAWKFGRSILKNTNVQSPVPLYMSNHYHSEHFSGAAAMLDEHLEQPELPFGDTIDRRKQPTVSFPVVERPDAAQLSRTGWDDMGCYYSEGQRS